MNRKITQRSEWNGSVFFGGSERVVFVGEAGTSVNQAVHALKICIGLDGDFELLTGSNAEGDRYSAVIINAGVVHTVKCGGTKIFLLYLLPETGIARELRWEFLNNDKDNGRRGVYDIPKKLINESLPFIHEMLRGYPRWGCEDAVKYSVKVVGGLGRLRHRRFTASYELGAQLNDKVRKTIDYIFSEVEAQITEQPFDLNQFESPVICRRLGLPPNKVRWLEQEFRKETGVTIKHFFHDIQFLAALKLYASAGESHSLDEEVRKSAERGLLEEMKKSTISEREVRELLTRPDELRKGVLLTRIAATLGFGKLTNFDKRVKSRIGINMADLRGKSKFFTCEEHPG